MKTSTEEIDIIKTTLKHCEDGSTDLQPKIMRNPVSIYTDPENLKNEVEILFRKFPIIVGHREQLAEPGSFFTHDDTGVPMLIVRTNDNKIKAFMNICRHRGARLTVGPCGKSKTFSCPYHKWTYDLTGALRGLPQAGGFGEIDKSQLGLIELPSFERYGLIWVRPSAGENSIDLASWIAPMEEQLSSLELENHTIYKEWSLNRKMNWHLALEGFQESYHFCGAHEHTACSAYLDNQSVWLDKYPHARHSVPLPTVVKMKDEPLSDWKYRPHFMTQNYVFPCNYIQVMTDHVYVHTIIPTGIDTCVFKCMMLIPEPAKTDKAKQYWQKNYNVVRTVFNEDFEIGENIQKGLNSGANKDFLFGRYEIGLHLGAKAIQDALSGSLKI
ncbi:MAG TPA: (2Fe-2S)-binding protein [Rhodobacteraceae bacterium]|nr:SRPBCC family protein [Amylibacter sp.]MDG1236642.1 SRPBCC family protein [Amylibacter sp.]MDG1997534.1 SRPBCC family protein [Amylibacter sp.]HAD28775.1 (2Fe-2S)-binding protein [Paracoccaceae bacterium]